MAFSESCKDIAIQGGVLTCQARKKDGEYVGAKIDLDGYVGNLDGAFVPEGSKFSETAQDIAVNGGILKGKLRRKNGAYVQQQFNLDGYVANDDGVLKFVE